MTSKMPSRNLDFMSPATAGVQPQTFKTPAEYISPLGRRYVALSNSAKRSPGTFLSPTDLMNDDEAEKRERQLTRVLELQRKSIGTSPVTSVERRQSLALGRLTNAQLAEHYADCIKLSTENKISSKNAFGLHLIDYIGDLFKKKDVTDFQLASSTIDASAKIYAGRVDAIHSETYKVLTDLGRGAHHKQKDAEDEKDDTGEVGEDGDKKNETDKKRKRACRSHTVETNLKNITFNKLDMDFEMDPTLQKTWAAVDEGEAAGLLLDQLRSVSDNCELILDCNTVVTASTDTSCSQSKSSKIIDISELKEIGTAGKFEELEICPQFAQFEFGNWNMDEMSFEFELPKATDHIFDLDAEPEPIEDLPPPKDICDMIEDEYDPVGADDIDDDANDFNSDAVFQASGDGRKQLEGTTAKLREGSTNDLISILTSEPSDYSYFRTDLLRTWAGPDHLRLQRLRQKDSTTVGEKTSKKSRTKEPFFVTFDESIDLALYFKQKRTATTITAITLEKHSRMKTTLPEDLHYDERQLLQLFVMPSVTIKRQKANSQLVEVAQYDYDNANDRCNFCPGASASDVAGGPEDDDDDNDMPEPLDFNLTSGDYTQIPASGQSPQMTMVEDSVCADYVLTGDNLVAPPRKIAKIEIDYAKAAKKIDVRHLKQTMWNIIAGQSKSTDVEKPVSPSKDSETKFQDLLNELAKKVSPSTAKNLSVPIAFVCLLHLANEKTLDIKNTGEVMSDLCITQDKSS